MTKTCCSEIYAAGAGAYEPSSSPLIREKAHHEILQETLRGFEFDVDTLRGIGRLLEKHGVARDFADVDWDREALGGKDAVHQRDVLGSQVAADAEDEDAGLQGGGDALVVEICVADVRVCLAG